MLEDVRAETRSPARPEWAGRFPRNEIISLLDVNRPYNLAESTSQDLSLGDILALTDLDQLRALKLGYGSSAGSQGLRERIGASCGVDPDQVLMTHGTALALFLLAFELCGAGEEVVLVTPCFPASRDTLVACGATIREVPTTFEDGYRIDVDRLAAALSPRTRLVSVATPQNPSGVAIEEATIRAILDAMTRISPQANLFVDETYRAATHGNAPMPASFANLDPCIITGGSISKAYGAPGLRVGWLTVPHDDLRERLRVAKMNIVISGSVLDEALAIAVLDAADTVLAPRRLMLQRTLATLDAWHRTEAHRLDWIRPDGGALCCMRLARHAFDEVAVARFWNGLPEHDLQLGSGAWFGDEARVFRLGFGYLPEARLPEALAALTRALSRAAAHPPAP